MTRLLIVESPNKVKHIEHHLGRRLAGRCLCRACA